jgi:hypothetical protein
VVSGFEGEAIVTWADNRNSLAGTYVTDLYARRVPIEADVPTRLLSARTELLEGVVWLEWRVEGVDAAFVLERTTPDQPWTEIARLVPDAEGRLVHGDHDVRVPARRSYRLQVRGASLETIGEISIDVPTPPLTLVVRPHPVSSRTLKLNIALPSAEESLLEVIDVSGRRVASRKLRLVAGNHVVEWDGVRLQPGVYGLRLTQGQRSVGTRAVVTAR